MAFVPHNFASSLHSTLIYVKKILFLCFNEHVTLFKVLSLVIFWRNEHGTNLG